MGLARIMAAGLDGISAYPVVAEVEVHGCGAYGTRVVGLPDAALREARDRVKAALRESDHTPPNGNVIVNLAPAQRRKEEGVAFDLPMALGLLAATRELPLQPDQLDGVAALGELSLSGRTRCVRGILAAAETLAGDPRVQRLLVPRGNGRTAALAAGGALAVYEVDSLNHALALVQGADEQPVAVDREALLARQDPGDGLDLADVRGQEPAKEALILAAAGGHDLVLVGPPGCGKTLLARRLPGLLPPLTWDEVLEVSRIHGVVGGEPGASEDGLVWTRPFRAPHHTASYAALVGGGSGPRPGEVTLAHKGILFLDELPEFPGRTVEALREPLEARTITISRARRTVCFPADFQLVAAMNPCPCGYAGHPNRPCRCSPLAAERYAGRVSGPLLDRIDLLVRVRPLPPEVLSAPLELAAAGETSASARARVAAARAVQLERSGCLNARLDRVELERVLRPTREARRALDAAIRAEVLSGRGLVRVQRVARTIADLDGRDSVDAAALALAVHLRVGDRVLA